MINLKWTVILLVLLMNCPGLGMGHPPELNRQITICIPVYNAQRTLKSCVEQAARYGRYQFLIYDNGSIDRTADVIGELGKTYDIITKTVPHQNVPQRNDKSFNAGQVRAALANDVTTPYLFFLDSDVYLAAPIDPLIRELNDKVGMAGYHYSQSNHLQVGAVLMKTEVARRIDWVQKPTCNCLNAIEQLAAMGLSTKAMPGIMLKHHK